MKCVNLSLTRPGFISIIGKSGSGKTTLANIISFLDSDVSGTIFVNGESTSKWTKSQKDSFRNSNIGVVFQHYNLLPNESVLYNLALPLLIDGVNENVAYSEAKVLLDKIGFPHELYEGKAQNLSGGEMQRVAILRAVIKNPMFLIADEPTGALDEKNSLIVMDLLKRISKKKCVIVISHNEKLMDEYSDRTVYLEDGKVTSDKVRHSSDKSLIITGRKKESRRRKKWIDYFSLDLAKRNRGKNLVFFFLIFFGLCFVNITNAVNAGAKRIITEEPRKTLDYYSFRISSKVNVPISNTEFSMTKITRLEDLVLKEYETKYKNLEFLPSFDSLLKNDGFFISKNNIEYTFLFSPIKSFNNRFVNTNLLIKKNQHLFKPNTVIINESAYNILLQESSGDILEDKYSLSFFKTLSYYTKDESNSFINDDFKYSQKVRIGGVVKEFSFLDEPCIYYSYEELSAFFSEFPLVNISKYLNKSTDVISYIKSSKSDDEITSYAHYSFLKDIRDVELYEKYITDLQNDNSIEIESNSLIRKKAFSNLISIASGAMGIMSVLVVTGSLLLLGIITYSSFVIYKKDIAILMLLGANKIDILHLFLNTNLLMSMAAFSFSFLLFRPIAFFINLGIKSITNISNLLSLSIAGFKTLNINSNLVNLGVMFGVILLVTFVPLFIFKTSPIKELKTDD